jgi:NAD+ synthase (glutamine-hydrolysing)
VKIAVAQINSTLGDFSANSEKILQFIERAEESSVDLIVFPEAALFGYHPFDLLEQTALVNAQLKELKKISTKMPKGIAAVVGCFTFNKSSRGRPFFNSAAFLEKGKPAKLFNKQLLPTGDVFDEARFIEAGNTQKNILSYKGKKILVTICEDIWAWPLKGKRNIYHENPLDQIKSKFDLVINLSASPYYPMKYETRKKLVELTAQKFKSSVVYANMVGAQDEIIYDGKSFGLDKSGKEIFVCESFQEDFKFFDLDDSVKRIQNKKLSTTEELRQALVLGIQDFCRKIGIQSVHLGISGGVDSAVVAALAVDALGAYNVKGIYMPTKYNSPVSEQLAEQLCRNLRIDYKNLNIQEILKQVSSVLETIVSVQGVTEENLQARIRGLLLMGFSNSKNSLLLSTSNKSEIACGYATLYGDMCGGLAPIGDLTKHQVYELAKLYNGQQTIIPEEILTREPTAELRDNQKDQDSLPPYPILDKAVVNLVEKCKPITGETEKWLFNMISKSEFKRFQSAPILKVSEHSFGRGRRYPIAKKLT